MSTAIILSHPLATCQTDFLAIIALTHSAQLSLKRGNKHMNTTCNHLLRTVWLIYIYIIIYNLNFSIFSQTQEQDSKGLL